MLAFGFAHKVWLGDSIHIVIEIYYCDHDIENALIKPLLIYHIAGYFVVIYFVFFVVFENLRILYHKF